MRFSLKQKAEKLLKNNKVKLVSRFKNLIFGVEGKAHTYNVICSKKGWSCDCLHWSLTGKDCSHILSAQLFAKENDIKI